VTSSSLVFFWNRRLPFTQRKTCEVAMLLNLSLSVLGGRAGGTSRRPPLHTPVASYLYTHARFCVVNPIRGPARLHPTVWAHYFEPPLLGC
jgi:hypothetical protein